MKERKYGIVKDPVYGFRRLDPLPERKEVGDFSSTISTALTQSSISAVVPVNLCVILKTEAFRWQASSLRLKHRKPPGQEV
jgi:hypothetical protein